MMFKLVGLFVAAALTGGLLYGTYKHYIVEPVFVAEEALAKGKELGALTEELLAEIRVEDFKSSAVVFVSWGAVLGLIGAVAAGPRSLVLRGLIGLLLGAGGGALANYGSDWYAVSSGQPMDVMQYWLIRWAILLLPMAIVAGVVASLAQFSVENLVQNIVKAVLAILVAAFIYAFVMGWLTPIEQSQYYFPHFTSNAISLLFSVNLMVYLSLALGGKPKVPDTLDEPPVDED